MSVFDDVSWTGSEAGGDPAGGSVRLTVHGPPPTATIDVIADQLVSGFWNGDAHHWAVTQGGTLAVDITTLNPSEQSLARAALQAWTDIIGIHFQEATSGAEITFDHSEDPGGPIAATDAMWSEGIMASAHIHISTSWVNENGTTLNTYSFQTYIHEIGHALGLGHPGNYNETATFSIDALFSNDSWATSVMSYFDQQESSYFASLGFAENFAVTPMIADVLAMQQLYGLSTSTRTDNSTYGYASGWHTNMGALCIYDSGGIDTIDVAGLGGDQLINLNPGTFSNVMGEIGNASIAPGVVIENATTSSGADTLIGNEVANILESGGGNDSLFGAAGDDLLRPGFGNNTVDGGLGNDTVDYLIGGLPGSVNVNLALGTATNTGGAGHDSLVSIENVRATHDNDTIVGDAGANRLEGAFGNDSIKGGAGNDTLFGDSSDPLPPASTIGGDDVLMGEDGDDTIFAGPGKDQLMGGDGNDTMHGGIGTDTLTGGVGTDTFIDSAGDLNGDTINDFSRGDRIVLSDATLAGFIYLLTDDQLTFAGGSLTLSNLRFASIAASAAPEGGVQITFSGPPIILSSGASVSLSSVGQLSFQTAESNKLTATKQVFAGSALHSDRLGGWHPDDGAIHCNALHPSQADLFALA